jgi:hypothetical protein
VPVAAVGCPVGFACGGGSVKTGGGGGGFVEGPSASGGSCWFCAGAGDVVPEDVWGVDWLLGCAAVPCAWAKCTKMSPVMLKKASPVTTLIDALLRRCVVPSFRIDMERWKSFRRKQLDLYLMPLAVVPWVLWTISEYILVA